MKNKFLKCKLDKNTNWGFPEKIFLIFDVLFNEFPDLQESLVQMH